MKKQQSTFYSFNTPFALLMGGCFILTSWLYTRDGSNLYANAALNQTIIFLYILGLFMQIRKFRESKLQKGCISYGKALQTGLWLSFVASFLYGFFIVLLYTFQPELMKSGLMTLRSIFLEMNENHNFASNMGDLLLIYSTPVSLGITELVQKFLTGTLYTFIIGAILRRSKSYRDNIQSNIQP